MDKLREHLVRELKQLDYQLENYNHSDTPEHRSFLAGKSEALVYTLDLLERILPEGESRERKLRELVEAQDKHIDRQAAFIEKQTAFIDSLLKGGK